MVMMNEFLQYLQYEKNYSSHTVLSYNTDLIQFCVFLKISPSEFNPRDIHFQQIQQWILSLMSASLTGRTLSRKISTLKSFWHFLLLRGYVDYNPLLKIVLPKTKKALPAFFKESEMSNVLNDSFLTDDFESQRNDLIIRLFYLTGVRLSELIGICNGDVDFIKHELKVLGKWNKQRLVPLGESLCADIKRYVALRNRSIEGNTNFLFVISNGKKMYPKLVYRIVYTNMSEVSSLHKRSPHVLRHTFATSVLNGGADINAVKEMLGHSSLAATQVYTHASFEELYNIYKHAHPRAK